jgi:membrane associated rhomboid family serine protease
MTTEGKTLPAPDASSKLAQVVHTICESSEEAWVEFIHTQGASLRLGTKAGVVILVWDEALANTFPERLKTLMKQKVEGMLVVVLLGGSKEARRVLKRAKPMITEVKVGQVHLDDSGAVWTRDAKIIKKALANLKTGAHPSPATWANLLEQGTSSTAARDERTKEAQTFLTSLDTRRPLATYALLAIILAVFGLEYAFGGTESSIVLMRMGALDPERVFAGEIWRLFSCTFLHAGILHVFFNSYVLWVIGSFLERRLGTWRFLALYGLSCLGASLASLMFLEGFSVGASGGLWGLLGAEAVLAWRPQGLLPRAMIDGARRAAKINLGINILNSFRPHVDMWAHFGGGAVGAALMLSGVLTRGLPRLGELESQKRFIDQEAVAIRTGPFLKLMGGLAAAVLLVGLGFGLGTGQPWTLKRPVELVQTPLPDLGISLRLPPGLQQTPSIEEDSQSVLVGNHTFNLGSAEISRYSGDFTDPTVLQEELTTLFELLKAPPPQGQIAAGPIEKTIANSPGVTVRYSYENGLEEELAFVFLEDALIKADTLRWPSFHQAVPRGYATKVLESLERLPTASDASLLPP